MPLSALNGADEKNVARLRHQILPSRLAREQMKQFSAADARTLKIIFNWVLVVGCRQPSLEEENNNKLLSNENIFVYEMKLFPSRTCFVRHLYGHNVGSYLQSAGNSIARDERWEHKNYYSAETAKNLCEPSQVSITFISMLPWSLDSLRRRLHEAFRCYFIVHRPPGGRLAYARLCFWKCAHGKFFYSQAIKQLQVKSREENCFDV